MTARAMRRRAAFQMLPRANLRRRVARSRAVARLWFYTQCLLGGIAVAAAFLVIVWNFYMVQLIVEGWNP